MLFFVLYIFIVCLGFFISDNRKQKNILFLSCFLLFFMLGFRDPKVGTDTERYCIEFAKYQFYSWNKVFSIGTNYGFYIFNKILSYLFHDNYTGYLLVVAFITAYSVWFFIKHNSEDYILSQIMLLSLGFILFFFSGIKQTLAMSILFFAYEKIKRNKIIPFIFLVLLSGMFHNTAFIFLLLLPIFMVKKNKYIVAIAPLIIIACYIFRNQIASFIRVILGDEYYSQYGSSYKSANNLTGLFIQLFIIIISASLYYTSDFRNEQYEKMFSIYIIGICFQSMTGVIAEFFRISMYFSVYGVMLFPNALRHSSFTVQSKLWIRVLAVVFFVFYLFAFSGNRFSYSFVW